MLTGKLRNQVDKIWEAFWTGGISNPISVIEQFTYLLFIRRLDDIHTQREQVANAIGMPLSNPVFAPGQEALRWHKFKNIDPQKMYERVRDEVFPFIKNLHDADSTFAQHMKDAIFMIPKASVLDQVVQLIDQLDLRDRDTNGDLYEYMLSKLSSAGTNGQFRTPRHIIRLMVALTAPVLDGDKSDTICDPAAGTCGFLMAAEEYVRARYGDPVLRHDNDSHFHNRMFTGFDFDQHMLRIGAMNLLLHGVNNPTVAYRDSLSDHGADMQIGLLPISGWLKGTVELTRFGEIITDAKGQTSIPGVFGAGDVTTVPYKQIVIAVGEGAKAALSAFDHLIRQG